MGRSTSSPISVFRNDRAAEAAGGGGKAVAKPHYGSRGFPADEEPTGEIAAM
jgi:hypothetical protein